MAVAALLGFRFSLKTLFVALTIAGVPAWWITTSIAAGRAQANYRETHSMWEAEMATTYELCQKSYELRDAELRVPLAGRRDALMGHLERITFIWEKMYAMSVVNNCNNSAAVRHEVDRIKQMQVEAQRAVDALP